MASRFAQPKRSASLLELLNSNVKRIEPSGRVPLSRYLRTARRLLGEAAEYRKEGNVGQLYVMLMRFASLLLDTVPKHPDSNPRGKEYLELKKSLVEKYIPELERLRDQVRRHDPNANHDDRTHDLLEEYKRKVLIKKGAIHCSQKDTHEDSTDGDSITSATTVMTDKYDLFRIPANSQESDEEMQ